MPANPAGINNQRVGQQSSKKKVNKKMNIEEVKKIIAELETVIVRLKAEIEKTE